MAPWRASRSLAEGGEQGVAQQRALLCRQVAARFDADTTTRLADMPITHSEPLAEVGH